MKNLGGNSFCAAVFCREGEDWKSEMKVNPFLDEFGRMKKIDLRNLGQGIELDDGSRIILIDTLGKQSEYPSPDRFRNIFRLAKSGTPIWQVRTDYDDDKSGPFTSVGYKERKLLANRWAGLLYEINLETGFGNVVAETRQRMRRRIHISNSRMNSSPTKSPWPH
jgi:hypothetical protein